MLEIFKNRLKQGHRTLAYPKGKVNLPDRFRGRPALDPSKCPDGCRACEESCPTQAITVAPRPKIDLGACLFCPGCIEACPTGAVSFTRDHQLAARKREELIVEGGSEARLATALDEKLRRVFGRSLKLRQVSAGGCNACEADLNVLGINVFDLGRFGIQFVASPRHADGIVITGPVTRNMRQALLDTWEATPSPRIAMAIGACAISGGPYAGSDEVVGIPEEIPIDLYIPGCPPHPLTLLDGFLRLLGRIEEKAGK